jgi:hypothetical protein
VHQGFNVLARRLSKNLRRRVGNVSIPAKLIISHLISVKSPLSKEREPLARMLRVMSEVIWRSTRPDNVVLTR